ncbi:MAG: MarR family transcriptional regulator [Pseudomonadota bacterium]
MSTNFKLPREDYLSLALDIDRLMRRIHANLHPKAQAVDAEKVGQLGGVILMTIQDLEPVLLRDLSAHLSRDKAQMTRHVQMLERKHLLSRKPSKGDGRKILIELTDRGNELVKAFQHELSNVIADMLPDADESEIKQFSKMVRRMIAGSSQ